MKKGNNMYLNRYCLRNFRRLENVNITLQDKETIFVGANNSGKTSATAAFRLFVSRNGDFKIHDFPSSLISQFDSFGKQDKFSDDIELPAIELDLWFTIDPSTHYGSVSHFLPDLASPHSEVGVRLCFSVKDLELLYNSYLEVHPKIKAITPDHDIQQKSLSHYLTQDSNLKKHFSLKYFRLEKNKGNNLCIHPLDDIEGKATLSLLLRVDYVEAQRNIDDDNTSRSNRLSDVFTAFYEHNLSKHESSAESRRVIEQSNTELSSHYENEFSTLISTISDLGFPAINDRELKVISNLSPEKALSGSAFLTYFDKETGHVLPEAYNGLGFKNLIFMAIQITHFQIRWFNTEVNRPLCQVIFIEEPEAHLHAQIQQVFIHKIRDVIEKTTKDLGCFGHVPQLVITSHSSHIIAESDFNCIRYFQRCKTKYSTISKSKLQSSDVLNLARFKSNQDEDENLEFLKKYLALTHCDLFFSDAIILVEGTVERLLMPQIIKTHFNGLQSSYITTLELGGAFSHKFASLLHFLNLPTLVITDLDSVDPASRMTSCRADTPNAVTSNASIKSLLLGWKKTFKKAEAEEEKAYKARTKITYLNTLGPKDKKVPDGSLYVSFQQPVPVPCYGEGKTMTPRTFEEAFIYENIDKIRSGEIDALIELPGTLDYDKAHEHVFMEVNNNFKKVEFALKQIEKPNNWIVPKYISEGLEWLSEKLTTKEPDTPVTLGSE
jgi:predicted ATP-dependent endonuclease of OLD family